MATGVRPCIVVSAVNFSEMGPLTILKEVLACLGESYSPKYDVVAIVHSKKLCDVPSIRYIEFPKVKSSWLRRLKFEYWDLKQLSRQLNAYLWLSLHDTTPNVEAVRQAVYCHNPSPFYRIRWKDVTADWKFLAFSYLYKLVYGINIHRNSFVIVQQDWLRKEFQRTYGVSNIVVAHPEIKALKCCQPAEHLNGPVTFFYPCFPRVFKNLEVLLAAAELLELEDVSFRVWLTVRGDENTYSKRLYRRFGQLRNVEFLGLQSRQEVFHRYATADCLVFPSKLETWGLPITEFKHFRKPMLLADLPYAHETVGSYDYVSFFKPDDPLGLAEIMKAVVSRSFSFSSSREMSISAPFTKNWTELFELILAE